MLCGSIWKDQRNEVPVSGRQPRFPPHRVSCLSQTQCRVGDRVAGIATPSRTLPMSTTGPSLLSTLVQRTLCLQKCDKSDSRQGCDDAVCLQQRCVDWMC